jgi:alpha-glucosidase (family GH31 glycosyl hydrolase)
LSGELKPEVFRVNPDKPYTIEERKKMIAYTPGAARPQIRPDPQQRGLYASHEMVGKSLLVQSTTGWRWKITAYDHYVLRMQIVRAGNEFPPADHMPVVKRLGQVSDLIVEDQGNELSVRTWATDGIPLKFDKENMGIKWLWTKGVLQDGSGVGYENTMATWEFQMQKDEQFFSLADGEDLTGQAIKCQYDKNVPSKVPGFGSSRNFGMLLNVNKPTGLILGKTNHFKLSYGYADQPMDLFVIIGQNKEEIMKRHAALMGN